MAEALSLCVSCKACRRECPTGVDMARMKLEWQHRRNGREGVHAREWLLASLPRLAPWASRLRPITNAGAGLAGRLAGLSAERTLPRWAGRPWRDAEATLASTMKGDAARATPAAALFVDTFTRWFEPEIARAAMAILRAGGWSVTPAAAPSGERPLCCGRTYLSAGMLDEARTEAERLLGVLVPLAERGVRIVGLEPSCLYTLRDEIPALLPGEASERVAARARMLEEFLDEEWQAGNELPLRAKHPSADGSPTSGARPSDARRILVHGHCHQKAFGGTAAKLAMLRRIPDADVEMIDSSCCGMAGAFGYHAEHRDVSMEMGELSLLPAIRAADTDTMLVADGTSCRAQIADGSGRTAVHAAVVLAETLEG
jgi:Fe-S oxidoreductase